MLKSSTWWWNSPTITESVTGVT